MSKKIAFYRQFKFFEKVHSQFVELVSLYQKRLHVRKDYALISNGDTIDGIYLIEKG